MISFDNNLPVLPNGHLPTNLTSIEETEVREWADDYQINLMKANLAIGDVDTAMKYFSDIYLNSNDEIFSILAKSIKNEL